MPKSTFLLCDLEPLSNALNSFLYKVLPSIRVSVFMLFPSMRFPFMKILQDLGKEKTLAALKLKLSQITFSPSFA